jgi:hypothetical protein
MPSGGVFREQLKLCIDHVFFVWSLYNRKKDILITNVEEKGKNQNASMGRRVGVTPAERSCSLHQNGKKRYDVYSIPAFSYMHASKTPLSTVEPDVHTHM